MEKDLVSVIVPTRNSFDNLKIFFDSFYLSNYKNFEIIVNDDSRTVDNTKELVKEYCLKNLDIKYIKDNISMAQARKSAAKQARGEYILSLDSDMKVSVGLLDECIELLKDKYDALVIPEESYGTTFWAKCKWLEKRCYNGVRQIESLRFLRKKDYDSIGGHDEKMIFSEDKDFDLRIRMAGFRVGRTKNVIYHNEGNLSLIKTLKKKLSYVNTANLFAEKHPADFKWQVNILNRYVIYLKNWKYLFSHPVLFVGMIFMKTCEFGFGAIGYLTKK